MPVISLSELLGRRGSRIGTSKLQLSDWTVTHDSIDDMEFKNYAIDSPRFRRVAVEDAPHIEPNVADPPEIDFTQATPDEIRAWQTQARKARAAREEAPPYSAWDKLTRDVFASYHTHDHPDVLDGPVDPGVELHKRILPKMMTTDEHAAARNITRDDPTMAAMATMAAVKALRDALGDELKEQAQESQEYAEKLEELREQMDQLEGLRQEARDHHDTGDPIPGDLVQAIRAAVEGKRELQQQAAAVAENASPMTLEALQAIERAAQAGQEAAENAANLPSFGAGLGQGEPVYESPEAALSIAEMWANNPDLRRMAELFGRLDKDIRFQRSKRIVGGQDEIVDIKLGDELRRVVASELSLLADEDYELDFLARFAAGELLVYSTVGEEHAGRGPIVCVLDGSYSMNGARNIWARAVAMCLLHIARLEKRDFAAIEFSGGDEFEQWIFPTREPLSAEQIIEMASHFFGGGTTPIVGIAAGTKLMENPTSPFTKADLVIVGDGEAGFGAEDKRLLELLTSRGVRLFGIGIGNEIRLGSGSSYLEKYCEHVVHVNDFELNDPSQATAELATHIT